MIFLAYTYCLFWDRGQDLQSQTLTLWGTFSVSPSLEQDLICCVGTEMFREVVCAFLSFEAELVSRKHQTKLWRPVPWRRNFVDLCHSLRPGSHFHRDKPSLHPLSLSLCSENPMNKPKIIFFSHFLVVLLF